MFVLICSTIPFVATKTSDYLFHNHNFFSSCKSTQMQDLGMLLSI